MDLGYLNRLLLQCSCGDETALEEVITSFQGLVRATVVARLGDDDVDDVIQDVLLAISQQLQRGKGPHDGRALADWIRTIAARKCFDAIRLRRKERPRRQVLDENILYVDCTEREKDLADRERAVRVAEKVLRNFSGQELKILVGVYQGRPRQEVADELGISLATLGRRKREVLQKAALLAQELWEAEDE